MNDIAHRVYGMTKAVRAYQAGTLDKASYHAAMSIFDVTEQDADNLANIHDDED